MAYAHGARSWEVEEERSNVQGPSEGKKEYLIKSLDFQSAQNPAFIE